MLRLKKVTLDNSVGVVLMMGGVIYSLDHQGWPKDAFLRNLWIDVVAPVLLVFCFLMLWHLRRPAIEIYKGERREFVNSFGANVTAVPWPFRWRFCLVMAIYLLVPCSVARVTWEHAVRSAKPWCYASVVHEGFWTTRGDSPITIWISNPTNSNAHNVDVFVRPVGVLTSGPATMGRDLEIARDHWVTVPLVRAQEDSATGLKYQFYDPMETFEITMTPEDGDAVDEKVWFTGTRECIISVVRLSDGKALIQGKAPPFDVWSGRYKGGLSDCPFKVPGSE